MEGAEEVGEEGGEAGGREGAGGHIIRASGVSVWLKLQVKIP